MARGGVFPVLICAFGLAAAASPAFSEAPAGTSGAETAAVAPGADLLPSCIGEAPDRARQLGHEARRQGAYRRAAECYEIAGERVMADRALAQAFAESNARNSEKAAATIESARLQVRRMREAFRKHRTEEG